MPAGYVALLRGINVGTAKRVSMADLKTLVEALGGTGVRTLLNSGNVLFSFEADPDDLGERIKAALVDRTGVSARVTVLTTREFAKVVVKNPLRKIAHDPTRLLVSFLNRPADVRGLKELAGREWAPEVMAVGSRVAYLWCPDGILASPLWAAVGKALGDSVTSRNWATVLKLHALASAAA